MSKLAAEIGVAEAEPGEVLVSQAKNNTKEQFANSPDFSSELMNAIMDAIRSGQQPVDATDPMIAPLLAAVQGQGQRAKEQNQGQLAERLSARLLQRARTPLEKARFKEAAWEEVNAAEELSAEASEAARMALARAAEARGRLSGAMGGDGGVGEAVARGVLQARRLSDCVSVRNSADAIAIAAALEGHATAWLVPDTGEAAGFSARPRSACKLS